uniref:Uncharacterized protein n=1 Tax=Anguilla anguilla TaxID=7936 RepID=A0A0E9TPB4_ANGAN
MTVTCRMVWQSTIVYISISVNVEIRDDAPEEQRSIEEEAGDARRRRSISSRPRGGATKALLQELTSVG